MVTFSQIQEGTRCIGATNLDDAKEPERNKDDVGPEDECTRPERNGDDRTIDGQFARQGSGIGDGATGEQAPPSQLDHYRLGRLIGKGGMGVVYRAYDRALDRDVAIKIIQQNSLGDRKNAKLIARFNEEARIAGSLAHSNIVPIHGVGFDKGFHYIAMQLIDGLSLAELWRHLRDRCAIEGGHTSASHHNASLTPETQTQSVQIADAMVDGSFVVGGDRKPNPAIGLGSSHADQSAIADETVAKDLIDGLTESKGFLGSPEYVASVIKIGIQVANAMHYAHEQGVAHRDIKPGNLLLDTKGNAWVADFGLAHRLTTAGTSPGGSLRFMAPEQFPSPSGAANASQSFPSSSEYDTQLSDIYSLGISIHELLTLQRAFDGTASQLPSEIQNQQFSFPIDSLPLPVDLRAVIAKATAKDPGDRYSSAGELRDDWQRYLDGEFVHAREPKLSERVVRWCQKKPASAFALFSVMMMAGFFAYATVASRIAAANESRLRIEADSARYLAEVRTSYLQYDQQIGAYGSGPATEFRPRPLTALQGVRRVTESVRSWESDWLFHLPQTEPELVGRFAESEAKVLDVEINRTEELLVSVDATGLMVLWNAKTGRVQRRLCHGRTKESPLQWVHHYADRDSGTSVTSWGKCYVDVSWLDENQFVAVSLNGVVTIFDVRDDSNRDLVESDRVLTCVAANADSVLLGDVNGKVTLYDFDGKQLASVSAEHGEVTTVKHLPGQKGWLIGYESGRVVQVDQRTLERLNEFDVEGVVWDLDAVEVDLGLTLAIGCEASAPILFRFDSTGLRTLALQPSHESRADAFHCIRFSQDKEKLYGANQAGVLTQWNLNSKSANWSLRVSAEDRRNRVVAEDATEKLPLVFNRRISSIREIALGRRLLTSGEDMLIKLFELDSEKLNIALPLTPRLGRDPRIAFDATEPTWLWGIGRDGVLHLLDIDQDELLSSTQAHPSGGTAISIAAQVGTVATVGGESTLRLWDHIDRSIVPHGIGAIEHSHRLVSVAISRDAKLVAAVDDQACVIVWRIDSGECLLQEPITPVSALNDYDPVAVSGARVPNTGKVAFNSDGSLLAAFGDGQSAAIFSTRRFQRLPKTMFVTGLGGTAMVWNPSNRLVLLSADDYPSYHTSSLDQKPNRLQLRSIAPEATCVAMIATPDAKRIICLERNGRILFVDTMLHMPTMDLKHPRNFDADISIDRLGRRIAIASRDGEIEIMDALHNQTPLTESVPREDRRHQWRKTIIVNASGDGAYASHRSVKFDREGRFHLLIVIPTRSSMSNEGQLFYVVGNERIERREEIEIDNAPVPRRFDYRATALTLAPDDSPRIVFRKRRESGDTWDGMLYQATRDTEWRASLVHAHGNEGFYPHISLNSDGKIDEIRHFTFDGFRGLRSRATEDGGEFKREYLGRYGDGFRANYVEREDGAIYSLSGWVPANCTNAPRVLIEDAGGQFRRQIVEPFGFTVGPSMANGEIFVLVLKGDEGAIMRRAGEKWVKHLSLPRGVVGGMQVNADGDVFVGPQMHETTGDVVLWEYLSATQEWHCGVIANVPDAAGPLTLALLLDQQGRPRVMMGNIGVSDGWITMLSRTPAASID